MKQQERPPTAEGGGKQAIPPQRTVATFFSYQDAEAAVDYLSDQRFPVERVAIVGRDLQSVEQVTGRMSYGRAAGNGAVTGGLLGLLFGWLFGLFGWVAPLVASLTLALYGLLWGAVIGVLLGILLHALSRGHRDFASVDGIRASRYEVVVDAVVAEEAAGLLRRWSV